MKATINYCNRLVLGTRSKNPRPGRLPRFLIPLIYFGRAKDKMAKHSVLSILACYRSITLRAVNDVASITGSFTGMWPDSKLLSLLKAATLFKEEAKVSSYSPAKFEWVTPWSSGPNGAPAWMYTYEDLAALNRGHLQS